MNEIITLPQPQPELTIGDIIQVTADESGNPLVSGRALHAWLGVDTEYRHWSKRNFDQLIEGEEFRSFLTETSDLGGRPATDHHLTLEAAEMVCMLSRTEKGNLARRYFVRIKKDWNSPEKVIARALQMTNELLSAERFKVEQLEAARAAAKPKELFADAVAAAQTDILIGELAKLLRQNSIDIGQNRLFDELRNDGYLISDKRRSDYNLPTQKAMDLNLFRIKESSVINADGTVRITKTTKVTGHGQIYFINRYLGRVENAISAHPANGGEITA